MNGRTQLMDEGLPAARVPETKTPLATYDDDDPPALSSHALQALREFLAEQSDATVDGGECASSSSREEEVLLLSEDWRLSQFWYSPETASTIAQEVVHLCSEALGGHPPAVACISCPTLYAYLKKLNLDVSVKLLEYDKRFQQYGDDFIFYDYKKSQDLPGELKHSYQIIVADPPYLSEECLQKVAETVAFLAQPEKVYLLLLTGEVQRDRAAKFLKAYPCGFEPQHSNKLGNAFRLFTNYDPGERLGGWTSE